MRSSINRALVGAFALILFSCIAYQVVRISLPFAPEVIAARRDLFLMGAKATLLLTLSATILGFFVGILVAWMKEVKWLGTQYLAQAFTIFTQGTPLLVQIFIIFFALPEVLASFGLNISIDEWKAAALALGLNVGAYHAEAFRGALLSIDDGQSKVARSLGLSRFQTFIFVLLPQASDRATLPFLSNTAALLKDSALASSIGVLELSLAGTRLTSETFKPVPALATVALIYLVFTGVIFLWRPVQKLLLEAQDGVH